MPKPSHDDFHIHRVRGCKTVHLWATLTTGICGHFARRKGILDPSVTSARSLKRDSQQERGSECLWTQPKPAVTSDLGQNQNFLMNLCWHAAPTGRVNAIVWGFGGLQGSGPCKRWSVCVCVCVCRGSVRVVNLPDLTTVVIPGIPSCVHLTYTHTDTHSHTDTHRHTHTHTHRQTDTHTLSQHFWRIPRGRPAWTWCGKRRLVCPSTFLFV